MTRIENKTNLEYNNRFGLFSSYWCHYATVPHSAHLFPLFTPHRLFCFADLSRQLCITWYLRGKRCRVYWKESWATQARALTHIKVYIYNMRRVYFQLMALFMPHFLSGLLGARCMQLPFLNGKLKVVARVVAALAFYQFYMREVEGHTRRRRAALNKSYNIEEATSIARFRVLIYAQTNKYLRSGHLKQRISSVKVLMKTDFSLLNSSINVPGFILYPSSKYLNVMVWRFQFSQPKTHLSPLRVPRGKCH